MFVFNHQKVLIDVLIMIAIIKNMYIGRQLMIVNGLMLFTDNHV